MSTSDLSPLFNRLMIGSQEALVEDHYEAAYSMLMAALHLAADAHNAPQLRAVMDQATRQMAWIDQHTPGRHTEAGGAQGRHRLDQYPTLLQQAQDILATMEHEQHRG